MRVLVTGEAGFIGSAVIRYILANTSDEVINIDKLTYAGNLSSLEKALPCDNYTLCQVDICDTAALEKVLNTHQSI